MITKSGLLKMKCQINKTEMVLYKMYSCSSKDDSTVNKIQYNAHPTITCNQ